VASPTLTKTLYSLQALALCDYQLNVCCGLFVCQLLHVLLSVCEHNTVLVVHLYSELMLSFGFNKLLKITSKLILADILG